MGLFWGLGVGFLFVFASFLVCELRWLRVCVMFVVLLSFVCLLELFVDGLGY